MSEFARILTKRFEIAALCVVTILQWPKSAAGDPPGEPEELRFDIPEANAQPGMTVAVPILVDTDTPLSMITFSVEYDTTALGLVGPVLSDEILAILAQNPGAEWEINWYADEAAGWVQVALVLDYGGHPEFTVPVGHQFPIVSLTFDVAPDAASGSSPITFARSDQPRHNSRFEGKKGPVYNSARRHGPPFRPDNRFDEGDAPGLEDGAVLIGVVGDLGIFLRGDANMDSSLDISDPVMLVSSLFLGMDLLKCEDAADANDDGVLDISDPVTILLYLFAQGGSAERSSLILDEDKTPDELGCVGY